MFGRRVTIALVLTVATVLLSTVDSPFARTTAFAQCQNQICNLNGSCYQCADQAGQGCRVDSCSSCTDTKCAAPLRLVSATVGSGGSPTGGCESTARPTTWDVLSLPKNGKTVMELAQPDSPIGIVEATFGTDSPLIKDALVKSWTDKPVHSYMLGRVDLYSDGTARIATDSAVVVRSDLSPQQIVETGPRDFGATALQNVRIRLMGFFVAEVTYADGSTWHENTSALLRNTTRGRWSLVAEGAN